MNQNQICHIFQRFPTRVLVARQKESGASYMTTRYKGSLFPHGDGTEITAPDATVNDTSTHTVTPTRASSVAPQLNTHWATPHGTAYKSVFGRATIKHPLGNSSRATVNTLGHILCRLQDRLQPRRFLGQSTFKAVYLLCSEGVHLRACHIADNYC
jgi:hypothetical protein